MNESHSPENIPLEKIFSSHEATAIREVLGADDSAQIIMNFITRGAEASVYIAGFGDNRVAIKRAKLLPDHEREVLHRLNGVPGVVRIIDPVDGTNSILLEYVPGKPIDEAITENGLIHLDSKESLANRISILRQLLNTLKQSAERGVYPIDLKEDNVLVEIKEGEIPQLPL